MSTSTSTNPDIDQSMAQEPLDWLASLKELAHSSDSPRQFFAAVPKRLRQEFNAWMAIVALPGRPGWMLMDTANDAENIDTELLRLQMLRAPGSVVTIRLADGRAARSLQATVGSGENAVGVGLVHLPEHAPEPFEQVVQLQRLQGVANLLAGSVAGLLSDTSLPAEGPDTGLSSTHRQRLREFHRSLDPQAVARTVAAETPWLIGCDRTAVLLAHGKRFRLTGVSGVAVVDRRGQAATMMERLCQAAMATGQPLIYSASHEQAPQIDERLQPYLDSSGIQSGMLLPLYAPASSQSQVDSKVQGKLLGAIAIENFTGEPIEAMTPRMQQVCDEAAVALNNAFLHRSVFLLPLWQWIGTLLSPALRYKTLAILLALAAAIAASLLIQTDYKVVANGVIEPASVQDVFAPADGQITRLHVQDGKVVKKGDLLIEIESADLLQKAEEIAGQLYTTQQKLAAIDSVLTSGNRKSGANERDANDLTIERRQLQAELSSLEAQQAVIQAEQQRLRVVSPIDGQIIGWRLSQRLNQRPISRGHRLFSIMDTAGANQLRLEVADRDSSDLKLAHDDAVEPLAIDFVLATEPDQTHQALLRDVAHSLRVTEEGSNVLDVIGTVNEDQRMAAHIGAEVTASIHCGRRSLLAAWFDDVCKFYHQRIRFYFS